MSVSTRRSSAPSPAPRGSASQELAAIRGTGRDGRVTKDDVTPMSRPARAVRRCVAAGGRVAAPAVRPAAQAAARPGVRRRCCRSIRRRRCRRRSRAAAAGRPRRSMAIPGVSFFGPSGGAEVKFKPYPAYTAAETRSTGEGPIEVVKMDVDAPADRRAHGPLQGDLAARRLGHRVRHDRHRPLPRGEQGRVRAEARVQADLHAVHRGGGGAGAPRLPDDERLGRGDRDPASSASSTSAWRWRSTTG